MIFFTDEELDRLIAEDVPYFDMTTTLAKFGSRLAKIQFYTKDLTVICCTEEVMRFFNKFSITPTLASLSGEIIEKNVKFLEAEGLVKHLHTIWRVSANLMEYASGIATRTYLMVEKARTINPNIVITATRRTIPYTRKISAKAVLVGGGNLNRLSLSENILLYKNHYKFFGGLNSLIKKIDMLQKNAAGKQISVEVETPEDALLICNLPISTVQLDKMSSDVLTDLVPKLREKNPNLRIAAAGGINLENVEEYTSTGIDAIVSSFPNHCKPADFRVEIEPLPD